MPPLRERPEDLPLLIADLADRIGGNGRPPVQFSTAALAALKTYRWPGNVRELGNLIERLAIQCGARPVGTADLPPRYRPADWEPDEPEVPDEAVTPEERTEELLVQPPTEAAEFESAVIEPRFADALLEEIPSGFDLRAHLETIEQGLISRAMQASDGTVAQAARLLGLRRTTLVEKLRKYSLIAGDAAVSET
jgi:sigma-54 dependent transcriptional regulator, flagellar regulatory protein